MTSQSTPLENKGLELAQVDHSEYMDVLEDHGASRCTIGCVIPAYNEEDSIGSVLQALLNQTRLPDVIHVVVNNSSDATVKVASEFSGPYQITTELGKQTVIQRSLNGGTHLA